MRIAIVNDMFMAVEAMRRVLMKAGGHQVAWIARDGAEAVKRCAEDRPDLVLMDLIMPQMDGIEATRRIMAKTPCAIVVVTANVEESTSKVFEAMGAGALDAVNTPVLSEPGNLEGAKALLTKIGTISRLIGSTEPSKPVSAHPNTSRLPALLPKRMVAIGASAGGPTALAKVLGALPERFPAAVVIVQHVDEQFAAGLADWLNSQTALPVRLAEVGDCPQAGTVYLAGRADHLVLNEHGRLGYTRFPENCWYRPSVDVFFRSVEKHWPGLDSPSPPTPPSPGGTQGEGGISVGGEGRPVSVVGVLLTGMGRDGAEGLKALRNRGCFTISQDAASCAVYGMPKAAAELGAATEILALDKIGPRLTNMFAQRTAS
ncbi:MAG: chemotaxis response regulator protein-glutamate methylesterase [Verrucomicrobia bacterium]|nr:chemotaxis response regulator protein-glutamate methylesterase [Verrucomicrobiota bacterium]